MELNMKFYNRELEIKRIKEIAQKGKEKSQMTIIPGRRRIGKTRLIFEAFSFSPASWYNRYFKIYNKVNGRV
jgi:hypothetical protein